MLNLSDPLHILPAIEGVAGFVLAAAVLYGVIALSMTIARRKG